MPLDATFTHSAALHDDASFTVKTSESSIVTSHAGPRKPWSRTLTTVIGARGGAWDGLIDRPRRTQFWAACTTRLLRRGTWPGAAAIVMGDVL
jgi:hypothetical protein